MSGMIKKNFVPHFVPIFAGLAPCLFPRRGFISIENASPDQPKSRKDFTSFYRGENITEFSELRILILLMCAQNLFWTWMFHLLLQRLTRTLLIVHCQLSIVVRHCGLRPAIPLNNGRLFLCSL
jgi:hypothetical protein